ncbi:hypothetical protein H010_02942 [Hydrogenophaga taeniospiralis CCUG 15921]|uniref:Uncharacterized protein n=1 Tax=Hydrogenophaga taeniospiralis CCUG 15921 TaxID=1281780 RepID=A0A9X4SDL4_9BURK|nr:hypothetical protein [Hydrogenophaga taeniospiralis CCUG 15921]
MPQRVVESGRIRGADPWRSPGQKLGFADLGCGLFLAEAIYFLLSLFTRPFVFVVQGICRHRGLGIGYWLSHKLEHYTE